MAPNTNTQAEPTRTVSLSQPLADQAIAPATIHANFDQQVRRSPDKIALKFGNSTLTYDELNRRADFLAAKLRRMGVQAETPVALYLERSLEMVIAILGVLKAGGAYVPMDLAYPHERMSFMLEDTAAPVVLTQRTLAAALPPSQAKILCVEDLLSENEPETSEAEHYSGSGPQNAAYVIYTSGSTGKPKGVIVTHHNVVRLLRSTEHWFRFSASDVWPLFHSYSFDMSVWELWGSLFYGGKLVIVPHATARSPHDFHKLLAEEKVTFLNQTPSAFRQLIWADLSAETPRALSLRHVTCGGEALELQSLRPWFEKHGDTTPTIVNMYGITETTVHTTYRPIRQADLDSGVGSVIGVPIPDLQVYLLDEHLKPVPPGIPGEICVGGAGVARGYLNRPELSAQRFIQDPFAGGNATMYRSGDLAQWNTRGEMEYLGRMDHQVKIRGFRVELGEIESALNRHPAIRESVVLARGDSAEKRLVAYFVPRDATPSTSGLRRYLEPILPDYMLPAAYVPMPRFPLTNNGKIDRRALPEPGPERPELTTAYVEPATETERKLAAIWQDVLGVNSVGTADNFFELGGDSIRAIILLSKARAQGLDCTLETLFQRPTIAGLAAAVTNAATPSAETAVAPFAMVSAEDRAQLPADVEDAYPPATLQLGMFFHNELDPLSAMYHDVFSFEIGAPFHAEHLNKALQLLVSRHPMLRTSFHLSGFSKPLQIVHSQVSAPFTHEDMRTLPPEQRQKAILDWIEQEKRRPFDRTTAPLMRFHVHQQTDTSFQLFVSFHHSCTDGWSLAALVTELLQDYSGFLQGADTTIVRPRIGYKEFIRLERHTIESPDAVAFWKQHLADAPSQTLPRWPGRAEPRAHEQLRGPEIIVAPAVLEGIKRLAQRAGVPLKTVLLAAHARVMALHFGHRDVVTGLVTNGRPEQTDGDKLIGLFLNMTPVRLKVGDGTWVDTVRDAFAAEQAVMPYRRFPLAEIQKLHSRSVLETAFDFVHFHVYNELRKCANLTFAEGPYFEANNLATYTTFMVDASGTRLELHIDYDPNEIALEQIEHMDACYIRTLEAMAAANEGSTAGFTPMPEPERHKLLHEWNATAEAYPEHLCIDQLIELRSKEIPNATAVECGETKLTYAELNARATALASTLAAAVPAGERIGLCVDRSPTMLVALLAILKTGCAYVPLDPAFPRERLEFIIRDAALHAIVSETAVLESLPSTSTPIITLDAPGRDNAFHSSPFAVSNQNRSSRDVAYVIYTSGSTGKPKGVQVEHRSVVNLLLSAAAKLKVQSADRLLAVTTLSFDIAGLELFMPLICGATVIIATREAVSDASLLRKSLETATLMQATPSTWRMLIESGWAGSPRLRAICGGEALSEKLASDLLPRCAELWNFYGPTETTIWSTAWKVDSTAPVTIGHPLANTQTYVLGPDLAPVPVGTIGELWIGGHGLARGYWKRPELTTEKFIPSPFVENEKIYRTGDLARHLPDGRIQCIGRIDHQVKIRGHRIETGEIEAALRTAPGVKEAVVTARADRFGENKLIAYIVPEAGPLETKGLRAQLAATLPGYMIPAQFVTLAELPLTPNGKIDIKRLPAPDEAAPSQDRYIRPEGAAETWIAGIWREVLDIPQVGAEDNIFELGADSLSATRAFARINAGGAQQLTLKEIFEHPTVRQMSRLLGPARPASRPITRQPRRGTGGTVLVT